MIIRNYNQMREFAIADVSNNMIYYTNDVGEHVVRYYNILCLGLHNVASGHTNFDRLSSHQLYTVPRVYFNN